MNRAEKEAQDDFITETAYRYRDAYNIVDDDNDFSVNVRVPKDSCWDSLFMMICFVWVVASLV